MRLKSRVLLFWLLVCGSLLVHAQEPVGVVEVELHGPLGELLVDAGRGQTSVQLPLGRGESRRLSVPVEVRDSIGPFEVQTDAGPDGARVLGRVTPPASWRALPRGLQSRSLPALPHVRPSPGSARLTWLAVAALLVLALRRRPGRAALVGLFGALGVFLLPTPIEGLRATIVLEGEASSGRWLEVRGARDRLDSEPEALHWMRAMPRGRGEHLEVLELQGNLRWRVCAPGARVFGFRELLPAPAVSRAGNGLADFELTWVREPGIGWSEHGSWRAGEPLPGALPEIRDNLPGWLVTGLPQGVGVFIGRSSEGDEARWVRLVGF